MGGLRLGDKMVETTDEEVEVEDVKETFTISLHQVNSHMYVYIHTHTHTYIALHPLLLHIPLGILFRIPGHVVGKPLLWLGEEDTSHSIGLGMWIHLTPSGVPGWRIRSLCEFVMCEFVMCP